MVVADMLSRSPFAKGTTAGDGEDEGKEVRSEIRDEDFEKENSGGEVCCLQRLSLRRNGGSDPRKDVSPFFTYKVENRDSNGITTDHPFRWETKENVQWESTTPVQFGTLQENMDRRSGMMFISLCNTMTLSRSKGFRIQASQSHPMIMGAM